jgi:hypothetical protein
MKYFVAPGGELAHLVSSVGLVCGGSTNERDKTASPTPRALAISYQPFALLFTPSPHTRLPHRYRSDGYLINFAVDWPLPDG